MDFRAKTEPDESSPICNSSGSRNLNMSTSEIVSVLRADVDRIEKSLVTRDAEIGPLQEKLEVERLMRLQAEQELHNKVEQFQELRNKNSELERKNLELMNLKRKWSADDTDDSLVVALMNRVTDLANENEKNFVTIQKLRAENHKLTHDLKKKTDTDNLGNVHTSVGGNTERKPQSALQRNIHTGGSESSANRDKPAGNNFYGHGDEGHIAARLEVQKEFEVMAQEKEDMYRMDGVNHIAGHLHIQPHRIVRPRRLKINPPHRRMESYLRQAGFYEASQIKCWQYDSALFSALLERWRPETHTFHLPYGECTITLQDVGYHLGLRIDGHPVTGCIGDHENHLKRDLDTFCQQLLGVVPPDDARRGRFVNLSWLDRTFKGINDDSSDEVVQRHTRAYILQLIGKFLLPDKSSSRVHLKWLPLLEDFEQCGNLSWGSAVLGTLYRYLCRATNYCVTDSGGCVALLISWAYHRIPSMRPNGFHHITFPVCQSWAGLPQRSDPDGPRLVQKRRMLDCISIDGFIWNPYVLPIQAVIPDYILASQASWTSACALICFEIVEWYNPDRVMRQFGRQQDIPRLTVNIEKVHKLDGRTVEKKWLPSEHAEWIKTWDERHANAVQPIYCVDKRHSIEYMHWYAARARRFLSAESTLVDPRAAKLPEAPHPPCK